MMTHKHTQKDRHKDKNIGALTRHTHSQRCTAHKYTVIYTHSNTHTHIHLSNTSYNLIKGILDRRNCDSVSEIDTWEDRHIGR